MKTLVTAMAVAAAAAVAFAPASSAQPTDPAAPQAVQACDWVTTAEASEILGQPVTPQPSEDIPGLNDPRCFYAVTGDDSGLGISSEVFTPTMPAVAKNWIANARTEPGAVTINGLGLDAMCVFEPQVTPPSSIIEVLLRGGRIYRATAMHEFCDTAERFARTAIGRIPA